MCLRESVSNKGMAEFWLEAPRRVARGEVKSGDRSSLIHAPRGLPALILLGSEKINPTGPGIA